MPEETAGLLEPRPAQHTVRTTMRPDLEIQVGDAELLDLQRNGLLHEEPAAPQAGTQPAPRKAAPRPTGQE